MIRASALFSALLILIFGAVAQADPFTEMDIERPSAPVDAPSFILTDLSGEKVSIASLSGKLVLLNFWATWCGPCRTEMPGMERLWQHYRDRGLEVIAVSIDNTGEKHIADFVRLLNLSYPILLDPNSQVADRYAVNGLPTSYLIDGKGQVIGRMVGGRKWNSPDADDLIDKLLGLHAETVSLKQAGTP